MHVQILYLLVRNLQWQLATIQAVFLKKATLRASRNRRFLSLDVALADRCRRASLTAGKEQPVGMQFVGGQCNRELTGILFF